jgi:hypothetical protein
VFFRFDTKKVFFRLFSHLKRNEIEMKRKQNEKEAKRSETKIFWKRSKAKIRSFNFALVGSDKFEAKRSEKNKFSRERAKCMRNGSRFASFRFEAKTFFCETGAP